MSEAEMLDMIRDAGFIVADGYRGVPNSTFAFPASMTNCLPELKNLINLAFQQGRIHERNS